MNKKPKKRIGIWIALAVSAVAVIAVAVVVILNMLKPLSTMYDNDMAIAILPRPEIPRAGRPDITITAGPDITITPGPDITITPGPSITPVEPTPAITDVPVYIVDEWTQTAVNLPQYVSFSKIVEHQYADQPDLRSSNYEGYKDNWTFNYKEHAFIDSYGMYDFMYGYDVNRTTGEVKNLYGVFNTEGTSREENAGKYKWFYTFLRVGDNYFRFGEDGVFLYDRDEHYFNEYINTNSRKRGKVIRVSWAENRVYIATGDAEGASRVAIVTCDLDTKEVIEERVIESSSMNIDLYAGFVVDDEEHFWFITKKKDGDHYDAYPSVWGFDGQEYSKDCESVVSLARSVDLVAYPMLQRTDDGIFIQNGTEVAFYDFNTHNISAVPGTQDSGIWKADGPYLYFIPTPDINLNNSTGYMTIGGRDYSNHAVYRIDVRTGKKITIDTSAYIDYIKSLGLANDSDGEIRDEYAMYYDYAFVFAMNRNSSVVTYYDSMEYDIQNKGVGPHFIEILIDASGAITFSDN